MGSKVRIIDPALDPRWDRFIQTHPQASIYHHSLWKEVIQKSFGYKAMYFILENEKDEIIGGMPSFLVNSWVTGKRLVSLSFSDYCDFLVQSEEDRGVLAQVMVETAKKVGASSVEVWLKSDGSMEQIGFQKGIVYKNHVLNLSEPLEVIRTKRIDKSYRYDLRKAERSDIVLIFGKDELDIKIYYELYVGTRKHHGLPPMPYAFFRNLWENLVGFDMVWLMLAVEKSKPIGGILAVEFRDTVYVLSNSSDRNYLDRRPNHLLWWKTIENARERGMKFLDFGRTATDNTGLLAFKRNWGAVEHNLTCFRMSNNRGTQHLTLHKEGLKRGLLTRACRVLPKGMLKFGSHMLYQHLG